MPPTTLRRTKNRREALALQPTVKTDEPMFGQHWTLDGYGANAQALNSMDLVFTVLNDLPTRLSMQKIMTPYVVRFDGNDKKDAGGYSGFVMIAESHISIHTFPAKGFLTVDVYTCQGELDVKACRAFFGQAFSVKEFEENLINRGQKYGTV